MQKVVTTQVGADGVLTLTVPLDKAAANKVVRVLVETVEGAVLPAAANDPTEWLRFIQQTAGSIPDPTFERHPQGTYEERDPLS